MSTRPLKTVLPGWDLQISYLLLEMKSYAQCQTSVPHLWSKVHYLVIIVKDLAQEK